MITGQQHCREKLFPLRSPKMNSEPHIVISFYVFPPYHHSALGKGPGPACQILWTGVLPRHGQKKNCTRDAIIRNNSDFRISIYVFNIQPANDLIVSYQMTN